MKPRNAMNIPTYEERMGHVKPAKKRVNSRQKGARVEREAAKFLCSLGFKAARMGRNGYSAADLDCAGCPVLSRVHVEVKGDQSIKLGTHALEMAMNQSCNAAQDGPYVVLWKHSRGPWLLTFYADSPPVQATVDTPERIKCVLLKLSGRTEADLADTGAAGGAGG